MPDLLYETRHGIHGPVAGVDEAGRGPLAGPVVAAAVILDPACVPPGIDDSKALTAAKRAALHDAILGCARVGLGICTVEEIDRLNIFWATMLAMTRAVAALDVAPGFVLVDGNRCPDWDHRSEAVVGGDALCLSIAAASIVAKQHRDALMIELDAMHPGYGWASNKGYAAKVHQQALRTLGPTPHHRRSFAPVAQAELDFGPAVRAL
ncbi:ribonuclease HII [Sphingomonas koreensis]|jgi:ribonuclease HII|uniref:Ribonuclease HII n=1 Tax=Sphingomonas koreensis TaxID=93064 RepID=A0A1L6J688_9SPHN|nr:ribonuclease HII [Sphingomonas koreensis]APR51463.1 ribonuclease HII [Sphingomonas koreensis]MDC7811044.1 ribonuclease HII [Sphingomonas koreensis]PJI88673.1 RNase HII [Sphingomonas koreensis]RSU22649.1 ribonuclease HII [Sphingomonas koreensis]RSU27678.1 ribonuclease HII [Sphingomonas koreensis]